ncbi:hypothetical protein BGW38_001160 [Lunasporangiospora selenospora]|uniref:Pre-mRNA-processing factor 40 n=1 Tax=Lunasporangiospora selenospora TaxID=979761 RepID=A0A9P6FU48_9FUNG|nr:hypothetical protein BGW38_001160 [Lunasporangiospora selenospora]
MADSKAALGTSGRKGLWVEYSHQDGRKYYHNSVTKETVWQKPNELKTSTELALDSCPWKEYTTSEGKRYYHNAAVQETVWTMPEEYKTLLDQLPEDSKSKDSSATPNRGSVPSPAMMSGPGPEAMPVPVVAPPRQQIPSSTVSTPSPLRHNISGGSQQHSPTPHQVQQLPPKPVQHLPPQQPPHPHPHPGKPSGPMEMTRNGPPFIPPQHSSRQPYPHNTSGPRPPRFQPTGVNATPAGSTPSSGGSGSNQIPDFATKDEAEAAFKNLLKETGVTSSWTWEQTMRAVVTNPMYRALKTTAERKAAFQDYVDERRVQERQEEKVRQQKQKQDFLSLLQSSGKVTHESRYTTISRLFAEDPVFKAIEDDRLRFSIFDGHVGELVRKAKEEARQKRKAGMAALTLLLQSMPEITLMTRWEAAWELLKENPKFKETEVMQGLNKVDLLSAFEDHVIHLEKGYDQQRARDRHLRKRTERKRREAFKELLAELRKMGQVHAKSMWMQIHPLIKLDARYLDMLGQPGSTPMELFWDLVEDLDEKLYQDRRTVQDLLRDIDFVILPETTFEEFSKAVTSRESVKISSEDLKMIYDQLLAKAAHYAKEERRRQEKLARKKAESFRYMLKSLDPPVTVGSTWEEIRAKAEATPEFSAIESEEKRKEIFGRFVERLKERVAKNYDSEDEDGSILEDDADYNRRYGGSSHADRKRASSTNYGGHGNSSSGGGGAAHHHHHHHSNGDHPRRSKDQPSTATSTTKRPRSSDEQPSNGKADVTSVAVIPEEGVEHKDKVIE